jgi:hypothetical protein
MAFRPIFVCLLLWTAPLWAAENLVANPGFESTQSGEEVPADWRFDWKSTHSGDAQHHPDKQPPDFGVDRRVFRSGRQSVRIGVARAEDDGVLTAAAIVADPSVKIYRASVWIKTQDFAGTTARVAAISSGDGGKWLAADYSLIAAGENHDWRRYLGYFIPAAGTREIRLRLWLNFEYAGRGTVWFDDVSFEPTDLDALPPLEYVDSGPMPTIRSEDSARGYLPFSRNTVETVYPTSLPRPEERLGVLRLTGFPGEKEAATFCLRALEELPRIRLEPGPLKSDGGGGIPADRVRVRPVECLVRTGQSRWGPLADRPMLQPVYLEETDETSAKKDSTRQLWVTVDVPDNTRPGNYRGGITLATEKSSWTLPVEIRVYGFALPEVEGLAFGMYSRLHDDDAFMDAIYADMRDHGMTTVGLCCPLGAKMEMVDGEVKVGFDTQTDLCRAMRAYQKAGFPEPVCWLMGSDVLQFARRQGPLESEAFANAYRAVILAILDWAKTAGWPEIIFQPVDEPFEHTQKLPDARRCLEIMKTIPGLRTEEDGPNGNPATLEELYELCDVIVQHDGPWFDRKRYDAEAWEKFLERTRADGKTIWFYNVDLTGYHPEAMRFGYGAGLWRAGGSGVIEWAYMFQYGRGPEDSAYTNPKTMFFRYPRTETRRGGPSIGWEAVRQGVQDYKLLSLFCQKASEAAQSGDTRRMEIARRLEAAVGSRLALIRFDRLQATAGKGRWTGPAAYSEDGAPTVSGRFKMDNGWTFADYEAFRALLAEAVAELIGAERPERGR